MFRTKDNLRLEEIVKLCDRPWIQQRNGDVVHGDWHYDRRERQMDTVDNDDLVTRFVFTPERYVWLPLSFRPEKAAWEVDLLIAEAGRYHSDADILEGYEAWRVREVVHKGQPCVLEEEGSPVELRLMFLNWLIDQMEEANAEKAKP